MIRFSVIIPVYNVAEYLEQCVGSVLNQTFSNFEIILVDDGSTDDSGKICDRYAVKHEIHVIHQKNQGLSAARNAGIREAKGEYLVFLDGDDYLEETALEIIQSSLEPDLDLLRYQAQEVFEDGEKIKYKETGFEAVTGIKAFSRLASYHYTENAWLYAYRREFWQNNHFSYAEGCISEDFGLTPLAIAEAKKVKAISDICYNYRQRTNSIMHDVDNSGRRTHDIFKQLQIILPKIAKINGSQEISHYLVVSYLTEATSLGKAQFLRIYHEAKTTGLLKYIHPSSIKMLPRSVLLKYLPNLFYRFYNVVV